MKLVSVKILCCPFYYCLVAIAAWTFVSAISDDGFCVELQPQIDRFKGDGASPIVKLACLLTVDLLICTNSWVHHP